MVNPLPNNRIFSSAVFRENPRYCYSLGVVIVHLCRHCRAKTVKFYNMSVITEDIYLKFGVCVHYPKSNLYYTAQKS